MATDSINPLGVSVSLSEMDSQAGEGVLVYNALGVPTFLAPTAAGQILKENSGGTALEFGSGGLSVLGSGSFTTSGAGVNLIDTIALSGDIGNAVIIFEGTWTRTTGAGANNELSLNNTNADTDSTWGTGPKAASGTLRLRMSKNPADLTNVNGLKEVDGVFSVITNSMEFDISTAENIFITAMTQDAGTIIKVNWIMYQIG